MAISRLVTIGDSAVPLSIDVDAWLPSVYTPTNWPSPVIVKRIDYKERNGYEVYGTKGTSTAVVLLAKVPYGHHIEVQ